MKNNKKILKLIIIFLAIFLIVYIIASAIIMRYVEKSINNIDVGVKISANEVILSPFKSSLLIKKINIDDKIFLEDVFIKIKILNLFKNVKSPIEYIRQISITDAEIVFDDNSSAKFPIQDILNNIFIEQGLIVFVNRLSFIGQPCVTLYNASLNMSQKEVLLSSDIEFFNFNVKAIYKITQRQDNLLDSHLILSANDNLQMYAAVKGTINKSSLALNHNIIFEHLEYRDFKISKMEGSIISGSKNLNFNLSGAFGYIVLTSKDLEEFILNAAVKGSTINDNIAADLKINYSYKKDIAKFYLSSDRMAF
ncbi:MAG: hypothetical protein LBN20_00525, partial [Endomicrobium sp.]|nr:hypothetical protein [Endomicrobium sp.]